MAVVVVSAVALVTLMAVVATVALVAIGAVEAIMIDRRGHRDCWGCRNRQSRRDCCCYCDCCGL